MKAVRLGLVLVSVSFMLFSCAAQQAGPDVVQTKAQIAQLEHKWLEALERADTGTIAAILADDFVRPAPQAGGFIGRSALLGYYRTHLSVDKTARKHIEEMRISVYGETAIARGKLVTTDASGRATALNLFTDVFVRRSGHWLAVSAQENPVAVQKP